MREMNGRPIEIIGVKQEQTVKEAAEIMKAKKVGCLIVTNRQDEFIGLITERDIAHFVAGNREEDPRHIQVQKIMTTHVVSCTPGTPTNKVREIMTTHGIRHLPIVDKNTVVGILSVRDLMGQQLAEDRAAAEEVAMLSNCLKSIDPQEAAAIVTKEAPRLFTADRCVLCLYQDGNTQQTPELESHNNCPQRQEALKGIQDSNELSPGEAVYLEKVPDDCEALQAHGPRLLIPINVCGANEMSGEPCRNLGGYICMCGLESTSATDIELIAYKAKLAKEILTSHLTNAALYQQARLTSLTDALTSVGSRKMLEDNLETEFARSQRYNKAFTIAILDLDNFKTINDVLGHATGDEALKRLAICVKEQMRGSDILARYGGDEFVILLPETQAEEASVLLDRIRIEVHKISLAPDMSVSISCGVAQSLLDRDNSAGDVMRRADLALYGAKSAGRDCVRIWDRTMTKLINTNDIEIGKIKQLQRRVAGLSEKAEKMFIQSIWGLVQALEAKNPYARQHSQNVMDYAVGIARAMEIGPKHLDIIRRAAMLHDIGKIGVPDEILSKTASLTPRERRIIEQHPLIAVRILDVMNFLENEIAIIRHHHEKWNGQGYPDGLAQNTIPLGARIIAVADTLDALTSSRSYRQLRPLHAAIKILVDSSSYEYDPEVVNGLICWVETLSRTLSKAPDYITGEDLLNSQKEQEGEFGHVEALLEAVTE